MTLTINRDFVTVTGRWGEREVHYRHAGSGPLLLMLHQSPQSSRELVPLLEQWGGHFTLVAPDTPGYGLSDPLGVEEAELGDFAAATLEFMDAIGADRFGIYGFHTGGMVGMAMAAAFPQRITALACNGVAVPDPAELDAIRATYLPEFVPRWDGGHLAWLWARTREQTIFFPWHNHTLAGRMDFAMPSPEHQQNSVLEFLRAGQHYRVAYRAAFEFHAETVATRLQVPTLITAADWDPLQPHLQRLGVPADHEFVRVSCVTTPADALQACQALLVDHPGDAATVLPASRSPRAALERHMVRIDNGEMLVRDGGNPGGEVCVLIHDAGASGALLAELAAELATQHRVIVPDLPGHGETQAGMPADAGAIERCADAVAAAIRALMTEQVTVIGWGAGAAIAVELATRSPGMLQACLLMEPPALSDADAAAWRECGRPALAPHWSGGHLLHAWHKVRDARLYFPWFRRDRSSIRWQEPELDEAGIQREVTELLKAEGSWQALLDAGLAYPLRERSGALQVPARCCFPAGSVWSAAAQALAADAGLSCTELPAATAAQAAALGELLGRGRSR